MKEEGEGRSSGGGEGRVGRHLLTGPRRTERGEKTEEGEMSIRDFLQQTV